VQVFVVKGVASP